jgi:hypothetical protein
MTVFKTSTQARPHVIATLTSPGFIGQVKKADLIMGKDEASGHEFVLFGRSTLEAVVKENRTAKVHQLVVPILQETDELEALIAAVRVAKGYDDYQADDADESDPLGLN